MYTLSVDDLNLPLYGPWTIVGRSVVIHENNAAEQPDSFVLILNRKVVGRCLPLLVLTKTGSIKAMSKR